MEIPFRLNTKHKTILRLLHETGTISLSKLENGFKTLRVAKEDPSEYLRRICGIEDTLHSIRWDRYWREEFDKDIKGLQFLGLVDMPPASGSRTLFLDKVSLTSQGTRVAKRIKEGRRVILRPPKELRSSVFVACAFGHEEIDKLYEQHLDPACNAVDLKPIRVDMTEPPQTITESIIAGITECQGVLADLTHARPSVYFEVGFAHGLGIPLVLTCRKDHHRGKSDSARVHFDLEHYKISFWSRTSGGNFRWPEGMRPTERLRAALRSKRG